MGDSRVRERRRRPRLGEEAPPPLVVGQPPPWPRPRGPSVRSSRIHHPHPARLRNSEPPELVARPRRRPGEGDVGPLRDPPHLGEERIRRHRPAGVHGRQSPRRRGVLVAGARLGARQDGRSRSLPLGPPFIKKDREEHASGPVGPAGRAVSTLVHAWPPQGGSCRPAHRSMKSRGKPVARAPRWEGVMVPPAREKRSEAEIRRLAAARSNTARRRGGYPPRLQARDLSSSRPCTAPTPTPARVPSRLFAGGVWRRAPTPSRRSTHAPLGLRRRPKGLPPLPPRRAPPRRPPAPAAGPSSISRPSSPVQHRPLLPPHRPPQPLRRAPRRPPPKTGPTVLRVDRPQLSFADLARVLHEDDASPSKARPSNREAARLLRHSS